MVSGSVDGGQYAFGRQNEAWTRIAVRTGVAAPGGAEAPSAASEATPATITEIESQARHPRRPDHPTVDRLGRVISSGYDGRRCDA